VRYGAIAVGKCGRFRCAHFSFFRLHIGIYIKPTSFCESVKMEILTKENVCEDLNVSMRGLEMMISRGEFPPGVRMGKKMYWCLEVLDNWKSRKFSSQRAWKPGRL